MSCAYCVVSGIAFGSVFSSGVAGLACRRLLKLVREKCAPSYLSYYIWTQDSSGFALMMWSLDFWGNLTFLVDYKATRAQRTNCAHRSPLRLWARMMSSTCGRHRIHEWDFEKEVSETLLSAENQLETNGLVFRSSHCAPRLTPSPISIGTTCEIHKAFLRALIARTLLVKVTVTSCKS